MIGGNFREEYEGVWACGMMLGAEAPRPDSYVDLGYQYPRPKHKSGALSPHGTPTTLCALVFLPLVCAMLLSCQISNSLMSEMVLKICDVSECYWIFVASVVTYILVAAVSICYFVAKEEVKQVGDFNVNVIRKVYKE